MRDIGRPDVTLFYCLYQLNDKLSGYNLVCFSMNVYQI